VATAVGSAVMDILTQGNVLEEVVRKGEVFQKRLFEMQQRFPKQIKEVRGKGLLVGIEFPFSSGPAIAYCREASLLVISAGENTLRFAPSLLLSDEQLDEGLGTFEKVLSRL
jgi:acetylornithine aminotransferase